MVERASALEGHNTPRQFGPVGPDGPGIRLSERPVASLWLIAAWPERLSQTGVAAANAAGVGLFVPPATAAITLFFRSATLFIEPTPLASQSLGYIEPSVNPGRLLSSLT